MNPQQTSEIPMYCINLDREPEKFKDIQTMFEPQFKVNRVSAYDGKVHKCSGMKGLLQTNKNLFEKFIKSDLKYVIIVEDDIYKLDSFDFMWPNIKNFIDTRDDWDFVKLDSILHLDGTKLIPEDCMFKVTKTRATGFMIYNINFLKKNFSYLSKLNNTLDMTMTMNPKFNQYVPKQLMVRQKVNKVSNTSGAKTSCYEILYQRTIALLEKTNAF